MQRGRCDVYTNVQKTDFDCIAMAFGWSINLHHLEFVDYSLDYSFTSIPSTYQLFIYSSSHSIPVVLRWRRSPYTDLRHHCPLPSVGSKTMPNAPKIFHPKPEKKSTRRPFFPSAARLFAFVIPHSSYSIPTHSSNIPSYTPIFDSPGPNYCIEYATEPLANTKPCAYFQYLLNWV
jgi:hypothetical protein